VVLAAGGVGLVDPTEAAQGAYGFEFRVRPLTSWLLSPALGFTFFGQDAHFAFAGLRRDFWATERWTFTPALDVGAYDRGNVLNLGGEVQFRSGLELAHRFGNDMRLGVAFYHLSNGGLDDLNPGTESVVVTFGLPVGRAADYRTD